MSELKPCPFCGGEAVFTFAGVSCTECPGFVIVDIDATEAEASAAWNTRVERTCKRKQLADGWECCTECNEELRDGDNYCPNCGAKVVEQ